MKKEILYSKKEEKKTKSKSDFKTKLIRTNRDLLKNNCSPPTNDPRIEFHRFDANFEFWEKQEQVRKENLKKTPGISSKKEVNFLDDPPERNVLMENKKKMEKMGDKLSDSAKSRMKRANLLYI